MVSVKRLASHQWIQKVAIIITALLLVILLASFIVDNGQQGTKRTAATRGGVSKQWTKTDVAQDDPELVRFVRDNHIFPANKLPYQFAGNLDGVQSFGQLQSIAHLLRKDSAGFFIEAGANDGEWGSNTFFLERSRGWNGLLVEASPLTFEKLMKRNRKAWHSNVALSLKPGPMIATFYENPQMSLWGGLTYRFYHKNEQKVQVQCIPLYTLMLAINRTEVDFFSLDLEGSELDVLRTIPWDKVNIKALAIEVINGQEGPEPVKKLMAKQGYHLHAIIPGLDDLIFINEELFQLNKRLEAENRTMNGPKNSR